jgi:protein involved in polysaccharide export with SLBB domain
MVTASLLAQTPADLMGVGRQSSDPLGSQAASPGAVQATPETPAKPAQSQTQGATGQEDQARSLTQQERLDREIRLAKAKEKGPKRFAADLFNTRQYGPSPTDGGISEDYVLGVGDRLQMNVYGSATFEVPLQVDGRGSVAVPKVGTVPVAGLSLAEARRAVQNKVGQIFSRSSVDLSVTKLREVRVLVLGEVYQPGSYLVPNLSSIINVLGLSGGPTAMGSYRDVRVIRGGRVVHAVDLYPLRANGIGNLNFGFQNGDTVFVPLVLNQIRMEGAFMRVTATVPDQVAEDEQPEDTELQKDLKRKIRQIEERLGLPLPFEEREPKSKEDRDEQWEEGRLRFGVNRQEAVLNSLRTEQNQAANNNQTYSESAQLAALGMAQATPNSGALGLSRGTAELLLPGERAELEYSLEVLKDELKASRKAKGRADRRVDDKATDTPEAELTGQPTWFTRWLAEGKAPVMLFEMRPGETVQDAVGYAGGFAIQGFSASVSLTRLGSDGAQNVQEIARTAMAATPVERGDVLTALPRRNYLMKSVKVTGWTRAQGLFSRGDGQRVGDFLKQYNLVLPDTYLERGELVHVAVDGSKTFVPFDLARALGGDPAANPVLEDRDEINLYRVGDLRLPRFLKVVGPVTRPGSYEFIEGMRASDLLFRAGVPLEKADRYVGELAHQVNGQVSEVVRLDLARLLSSEGKSPVDLKDDAVNPLLRANDQISVFAKPDYKPRRSIILTGQVVRPGVYDLDNPKSSLREVLARAGGLTPEAMPEAGIFLRNIRPVDPDRKKASILSGIQDTGFASNGVNDILNRLNETKRNSSTGALQPSPLLHAFQAGDINRLVVNFKGILAGDPAAEVELQDGDEIIIPRRTDVVYVVGETASPFAAFKVAPGMKVSDVVTLAGGYTRNADTSQVRLLKADGRIVDRWVSSKPVQPGDALLVPQRIRRDVNWTEQLAALTPIAILINTFK